MCVASGPTRGITQPFPEKASPLIPEVKLPGGVGKWLDAAGKGAVRVGELLTNPQKLGTMVINGLSPASTLDPAGAQTVAPGGQDRNHLPSVQDDAQRRARAAEMMRLISGRGRASTFLSGSGSKGY